MASLADPTSEPQERENSARVVWTLAWPAVALNSLQVVNNLLDTTFVGRLEPSALTAHSASIIVIFLMFSLAMALGTAATAFVSRAFGAHDSTEYRKAARQCLGLAIAGGFVLSGVCALMARPVAMQFIPAGNDRAIELMAQFLTAYALSLPAIHVIQALAGSLRGIGDTKSPMVISGLQILLHIALNYLLIFPTRETAAGIVLPGAGLGLVGAALALSISAWIAAIVYLAHGVRTPLGSLWRIPMPSLEWTRRIVRIAAPAAVMGVLRVGSLAAFMAVLKYVPNGSTAIGAVRAGFTIESIMFMPAFGLSVAAAALVGQSLGMKRPDRAERLAWTAGHHAALVGVLLGLPIFLGADWIANLLIAGKPEIAHQAASLIRWLCLTEFMFGYAMVMLGAMQGAGDTVRPMWVTVISLWLLRVPLAWMLALPLGLGATGAWISMSGTQAVQGVLSVWLFKLGAWKAKEI